MQIVTYAERRLVKRHRGSLPILLTCPHGGSGEPENIDERTDRETPAGCDFVNSRDNETKKITQGVAQEILDITGLSPYVVIAGYHRKFIDANRSDTCAFTDPAARPFYEEYHHRIEGYIDQILSQNQNRGFLFDIHGTRVIEDDRADVYLGTANGDSLVPDFDRKNIFMRHGLHGLLKGSIREKDSDGTVQLFRYGVSPEDETAPETGQVCCGFTIRKYGTRINCIQVEIADTIRDDAENRGFFIEDLAFAVINSVRRYVPF